MQISDLEQARQLDPLAHAEKRAVQAVVPPGPVRDLLHGVWLGHPLHPVLAQVSVGAWMSATALDSLPGGDRASRRLVVIGLAAAAPTALAGAVDCSAQHEQHLRVGVVHALANAAAAGFYLGSLAARRRGSARLLRLAGLAAASFGGMLGGHLSFRLAGGTNQAEPVPHLVKPGWHDLLPAADLPDGRPVRRMLGEVPVLAVRDNGEVHVLAERCAHLSGPLSQGSVSGGCVRCPWHGSTFRLRDGAVVHGPATAPQPVFRTRLVSGMIQVCLPDAG